MKQLRICVLVLFLGVSLGFAAEELHRAGDLLYEDLSQVPFITEAKGGAPRVAFGSADLSSQMPPVGNQGAQGSCVAWSVGYYHKGHTEWVEQQWDQSLTTHQFSPAFMYNLINGGRDAGAYFSDAAYLIVDIGLTTMAEMPYSQSNYTNWPTESAWATAAPYRGEAAYYINCTSTAGLDIIKARLDAGYTTVLGIYVWSNFDYINNFDTVYCVADRYGTNRGGHGVTIVGYDDAKVTHDGVGAFRLVNSWGTGWGNHGYWWMSYQAVMDSYLSHRQAYYITDRVGYQPTLLGRVQISHSARERVGIRLGVGSSASPLWYKDFLPRVTPSADYAFPANKIVLDMTEGAGYIEGGSTDSVFARCLDNRSDGRTGTLTFFSAEYLPGSVTAVSPETPVDIPDYGTAVYARAGFGVSHDFDVGAASIIAPSGTVVPGSVITPSCQVQNYGTSAATFPVRMRISNGYEQVVTVTDLAAGATRTVDFPGWTASEPGDFAVTCSTELAGDEAEGNDRASGSVSVSYPAKDAGTVSIDAPSGTVNLGAVVTPSCVVKNFGTASVGFSVRMRIGSGYNETVSIKRLKGGATRSVSFPNWTASAPGTFAVTCSTELADDGYAGNDKATGSVLVGGDLVDAGTVSIIAPSGTVAPGSVITPSCEVKNFGTAAATFPVRMKIGAGYEQAVTVTDLAAGATLAVDFPDWTASENGTFAVTCSTELAADENSANDKVSGSVTVGTESHDVACTVVLAPTGTVQLRSFVIPACSLYNHGSDAETYTVRMRVSDGYEQTATVTHAPGTALYVEFKKWRAGSLGEFAVNCSTELAGDESNANDKATGSVLVTQSGGSGGADPVSAAFVDVSPNPVTGSAVVRYGLAQAGPVRIELYDATGTPRLVLAQGRQQAGRYTCRLRAGESGLAAGVYFLRFTHESGRTTGKVIIE